MCAAKSNRLRKTRLELEIEKNRAEGNLTKALDLAHAYKSEPGGICVCLFNLVYCENKLELYEKEFSFAINFADAENAVDEALKHADDQYRYEGLILKAKIAFLQDNFVRVTELLSGTYLKSAKIESCTSRFTRLICEGFAILGISKERIADSSKLTVVDEEEICEYYDLASNICIRHLQELEESMPQTSQPLNLLPKVVYIAIRRNVLFPLQHNDVGTAVLRMRRILRFIETPSIKTLRQFLSRQLAELLLRVVCSGNYQKYPISAERDLKKSQTMPYSNPARYSVDRFIPDDQLQEAILMLLISEYIASQDVILNRSSGLSIERKKTVDETIAIYDLLAIALVRKGCFTFLSNTLERALKFSYCEFQIWYQFALSLISSRKYYRAYLILRECQRINPEKSNIYLLASSLCLGHLNLIEEGKAFAIKGVKITEINNEKYLSARAHLMLGWSYSILFRECRMPNRKIDLQLLAIKEYKMATITDPDDYLAWYHLAVELATKRCLEDAFKACKRAIFLAPLNSDTIRLLALLHTAAAKNGERSKRLEQAAKALESGIYDRPNDFSLLFTLALVKAQLNGTAAGLEVYQRLLDVWRECYSTAYDNNAALKRLRLASQEHSNIENETISVIEFPFSEFPENEVGINVAGNTCSFVTANRLEATFVELAESRYPCPVTSPTQPDNRNSVSAFSVLAKIWSAMAELYIESDCTRSAHECVEEAISHSQMNHELLYLRGRVLESNGLIKEAKAMYESAIAINPSHLKSIYCLARCLRSCNQNILAQQALRDALAIDSTNSSVWRLLGEVLSGIDSDDHASKATATTAFMSAIELEQTEPIEPFYTLRLGVYCN